MCCGYFYSASSSPLLLRGIPDYSIDTVSELTRRSAAGKTTSEGLAQVPYVAARVGFEPATFRTQGTEPTTKPRRPMMLRKNIDGYEQLCVRDYIKTYDTYTLSVYPTDVTGRLLDY